MHAYDMHTPDMQAHDMHAHDMHAHDMQAHDMANIGSLENFTLAAVVLSTGLVRQLSACRRNNGMARI